MNRLLLLLLIACTKSDPDPVVKDPVTCKKDCWLITQTTIVRDCIDPQALPWISELGSKQNIGGLCGQFLKEAENRQWGSEWKAKCDDKKDSFSLRKIVRCSN